MACMQQQRSSWAVRRRCQASKTGYEAAPAAGAPRAGRCCRCCCCRPLLPVRAPVCSGSPSSSEHRLVRWRKKASSPSGMPWQAAAGREGGTQGERAAGAVFDERLSDGWPGCSEHARRLCGGGAALQAPCRSRGLTTREQSSAGSGAEALTALEVDDLGSQVRHGGQLALQPGQVNRLEIDPQIGANLAVRQSTQTGGQRMTAGRGPPRQQRRQALVPQRSC